MRSSIRVLSCALLLAGAGCLKKPYRPAGAPSPLDASGIYAVTESVYSGTCPAMSARKDPFRVEVQHPAGALTMKMTVDGLPFDAQVRRDGNFTSVIQMTPGGRYASTTNVAGRFTDAGFSARVTIRTVMPVTRARPGDPSTTTCDYQLLWAAKKL